MVNKKSFSVMLALGMLLSGCSQASSGDGNSASSTALPSAPKGLEKFYSQDVKWSSCDDSGDECAEIEVPLDYEKPDGKTIKIALRKHKAEGDDPIGTLFVNPGGPGVSGVEYVTLVGEDFSRDVREAYDIIGFDPRGVGQSTAVDCLDDEELGDFLDASYDMSDPAQVEQQKQDARGFVDGCKEKSGDLLQFVGTEHAARDMDVMRQLVGDPKINYVGFSYGTSLGATYADLFPENVGRMILDGAYDDSVSEVQSVYSQTLGFEKALTNYLQDCVDSGSCVLGNNVDEGRKKVRELLDTAQASPFPTENSERPLTQKQLAYGIIATLYSDEQWQDLTQAFEQLINNNDGTVFQTIVDAFYGRDGDKFQGSWYEASIAITCASMPPSNEEEKAEVAKKLEQEAPVFGEKTGGEGSAGNDVSDCSLWPSKPQVASKPHKAEGSDTIVVVGTRNDPATPYEGAVTMHKNLDNSVLVTWEGEGHLAYGRAGKCINKPLDDYLLEGTVPKDGLTCPAA